MNAQASALVRQFARPSGALGRVAGWIMATRPSNRERNRWTVELLDLAPGDRVLELGYGPGVAIAHAARTAVTGSVTGIDHSATMRAQAARRNRDAIAAGHVVLRTGGLDLLAEYPRCFDKAFSVNVLQFMDDRRAALVALRGVLVPGGIAATTYMPRHRSAWAGDAERYAASLAKDLAAAGFTGIRIERLALRPMPAVCVLGQVAM